MVARSSPSTNYRPFSKGGSFSPYDDTPLSQTDTSAFPLQNSVNNDDNVDKQRRFRWHSLCYFLHVFLVALHIVLLVISASNHAEHQITIPFGNGVSTILSGSLQSFYILYTALLVFVTQRLVLSATFSSPKKLTQIHDICSAWSGLGAALSALWSQTTVPSSVSSVVFVTVYFACISVLHVASSTVMQLQPFNGTVTKMVPAVATWPGPSVNLSSLDWGMAVAPLLPFLPNLYGNVTSGLANNTLYDIPSQSFVNATVNATTLHAHCGLLTNFSASSIGLDYGPSINVSMTDMDPFTITINPAPLSNEIFFSPDVTCAPLNPQSQVCQKFILYLVSAAVEGDESANDISPIYVYGSYDPMGGRNFSTPTHFVACSLDVTTQMTTIGPSGNQFNIVNQPTDVAWSTVSPGGNMMLTTGISIAMNTANSLASSPYCHPLIAPELWFLVTAFDVYMSDILGIDLSICNQASQSNPTPQYMNGTSLGYYTGTPSLLTRIQMEAAVSQIATEFIWLAGKLSGGTGGFDRQTDMCQVTQYVLEWRLNINTLPVITSLCASFILCILLVCMLWNQNRQLVPVPVSAAGVLEVMWLGSRSRMLRGHLSDMQNPSVDSLRASSMLEPIVWTCPGQVHAEKEDSRIYAAVPLDDLGTPTSSPGSLASFEFRKTTRSRDSYQPREPVHVPDGASRTRRWCYALHIVLVALHVVLLSFLVHHPEHSVIIPIASNTITTSLTALLQAVYTLYSTLLVIITQRLSLFRIIGERRKLTTVHDVSGAWTGIGTAFYVLWQQRQIASSILEVTAVVTYLISMLLLHICSSSIMQWQAFNSTLVDVLASDLALPGSTVNISQLDWLGIFPLVQPVSMDTSVSTYGLSNHTIYDVPQVPINVTFLGASVNATTFDVQCGLVPNLTIIYEFGTGAYQVNFSLNGIDNGYFFLSSTWKDIVNLVSQDQGLPECAACPRTLFYMMTTGINVDESVRDGFALNLNWTYTPSRGNPQNSTTLTYIAGCSVSARTVPATLNLQDHQLVPTTDMVASSSNTSWSVWSPGDATDLSVGIATALANIEHYSVEDDGFTELDSYMMNLLGLNLSSAITTSESQSSANPSVTLSPWQLENAIAQTTAKFLWTAGQLGESAGGFQRAAGESRATRNILKWRLNLNTVPLVFVSLASLTALVLVPFLIGKEPSKERLPMISGTSVLESLWLEAHSEALHSRLNAIEDPRSDRLRAVGMFDVVLGDVGRSSLASRVEANLDDA